MKLMYRIISLAFFCQIIISCQQDHGIKEGIFINEILTNNTCSGYDNDFNNFSDWIELYNAYPEDKDISGWEIKIGKRKTSSWFLPKNTFLKSKGYIIIWADKKDTANHANFKLNSKSKHIQLINKGLTIDSIKIPQKQVINVSYGRKSDGENNWVYFHTPTPKNNNFLKKGVKKIKRSEAPKFSKKGGVYTSELIIEISTNEGNEIRYTIDGSRPNETSILYKEPIKVNDVKCIRAISMNSVNLASKIVTNTYFVNPKGNLPFVSISTDFESLWNSEYGIYENSIKKQNRLANFEYFDGKKQVINQEIDLSLHGNVAKNHPQKAFKVTAKKKYGESTFKYNFFNNKKANSFESLLIRAGGHADHFYTQFRDELAQHLHVDHTTIDFQGSRPIIVYLNGEFWGIYNLKEKLNAAYITSNYGLKEGQFSMLEQSWQEVKTGKRESYDQMLKFIASCEKNPENYTKVKSLMDVYNFIDYNIVEMYVANVDWPNWNIKYWKEESDTGKWKWIITDLDFGFDEGARVTKNMIEYATSPVKTRETNPPPSTLLLRKLFDFKEFKDEFIQRMAVSLNVIYNSNRVINKIEQEKSWRIEIMPKEIEKWGGEIFKSQWGDFSLVTSMKGWEKHIERLREFARKRPDIMRSNIKKHFDLNSLITINTESNGGLISINSIKIPQLKGTGKYFSGIPVRLEAHKKEGVKFSGWQINDKYYTDKSLTVTLLSNSKINAIYKKQELANQ